MKDNERPVQRKTTKPTVEIAPAAESGVEEKSVLGIKPPKYGLSTNATHNDTMGEMEQSFGQDFSGVKIHKGSDAAKKTSEMNARAYTQGSDIYFNSGEYNPTSSKGKGLLAHELTHVVQQSQGRVNTTTQQKGVNVNDQSSLEKEADDAGSAVVAGRSAKSVVSGSPGGHATSGSGIAQFKLTPKKKSFYKEVATKLVTGLMQQGVSRDKSYYVVAQVLQENGWNTEAPPGNNYFNIKGSNDGKSITLNTHEEDHAGNRTLIKDEFRVYESLAESMADYLNVLRGKFPDAYDALYNPDKGISDFVTGLANGVHGRYATDKDYSEQVTTLSNQVAREFGAAVPDYKSPELAQLPADAKKPEDVRKPLTDYDHLAMLLYSAMRGYGTNEAQVYSTLSLLQNKQQKIDRLKLTYQERYGKDLIGHINSEFSNSWIYGNQLDQALAYLNISPSSGESVEKPAPVAEKPAVKDKLARVDMQKNDRSRVQNRWKDDDGKTEFADKFNKQVNTHIEAFFGAGYTRDKVLQEIAAAKAAGNADKAEELRIKLFNANMYNVVDTLDVENNSLHKPGGGKTYCNIYAYDVVTAMGGYLPRVWWDSANEKKALEAQAKGETYNPAAKISYVTGGKEKDNNTREMNANSLNAWLPRIGQPYFGWEKAGSMEAGQQAANSGYIVIISAANKKSNRSGHINVILPETEQYKSTGEGDKMKPLQSQAGSSNFAHKPHKTQWWKDANHKNGAAWIYKGELSSPIMTPEQMGGATTGKVTEGPKAGDQQGEAGPVLDKTETTQVDKQGMVTASALNIRPEANTDQAPIGQLKKKDVVKIVGESNGWYQIGQGGWVSGKYLKVSTRQTEGESLFDKAQLTSIANLAHQAGGDHISLYNALSLLNHDEESIKAFKSIFSTIYGKSIEEHINEQYKGIYKTIALYLLRPNVPQKDKPKEVEDNGYDDNWPLRKVWTNPAGNEVKRKDNPDGDFGTDRPGHKHAGIDLNMGGGSADEGAPVYATHDGKVEYCKGIADDKDGAGNRVSIISDDGTYRTRYFHLMEKPDLKTGQEILEGMIIGKVGGSGKGKSNNYVPHLHYEVHVKVDGTWTKKDPMKDGKIQAPEDVE